jgi:hypothetical protein
MLRRANQRHGQRSARAFAEPHLQIEQRPQADQFQQRPMPRLAGPMGGQQVITNARVKPRRQRGRGRRDEAVHQHGAPIRRRAQAQPAHRADLEPSQPRE